MDPDEFEDELDELPSRKTNALDFVIAFVALIGCFFEAFSAFFNHITRLLVMHRSYEDDRQSFADAIRADLESIPTKEV